MTVRGRFAPSPTGSLHFGSLVTALGSYLHARSQNGEWTLRIDDLDVERNVPAALSDIPRQLEALGLRWDGAIDYQSQHEKQHRDAVQTLLNRGQAFHCGCSRKEIAMYARSGIDGPVYPGTCREGLPPGKSPRAIRINVDDGHVGFDDPLQGHIDCRLAQDIGDFIIQRADGLIAYQLAAAVDDATRPFTNIVRGADLISSTLRQLWVQICLGLRSPRYIHLPIATNRNGEKLSKQTRVKPIDSRQPDKPLLAALEFLSQNPPMDLYGHAPDDILNWAVAHWTPQRLRGVLKKETPISFLH